MNPTTPFTISRRNVLHTAATLGVLGAIGSSARGEFWLSDGIHPSTSGHAIMADFWRETTGI